MSEAVNVKSRRPRNIDLSQILFAYRLPAAGRVSILHRVSGALLFLALPFLLYLFEQSLTSEISYENFRALFANGLVKLVLAVLAWGYLHHFCAGVRHLFMDMHMGLERESAGRSAVIVLVLGVVLGLAVAAKIFGVF